MSGFLKKLVYGDKPVIPTAPTNPLSSSSGTHAKQNYSRLSPQSPHAKRKLIADDTIKNSEAIIEKYASRGASKEGKFYRTLPKLSEGEWKGRNPGFKGERKTRVVVADSFVALRQIIADGAAEEKTAVLNLASDIRPAGGWESSLSETQEEALCYSSTLYCTLDAKYYPWDNASTSGIFSPGVVVYKDTLANKCELLKEEDVTVTSILTIAAPRWRPVTLDHKEFRNPKHLEELREKLRSVYRMAAIEGRTNLVLGAMGCGAYGCPKERVATEMRDILLEDEFHGWFERVWWAVFDPLGEGNSGIFGEVCDGVVFQ